MTSPKFSFSVIVFYFLEDSFPLWGGSFPLSSAPQSSHSPCQVLEKGTTLRHIEVKFPASRIRLSPPPLPEDVQGNEALRAFLSSSFLGHGCVLEIG